MLLGHSVWGGSSHGDANLPTAQSLCVSDKEQRAGAADLIPHESRAGLMWIHPDTWGTYLQEIWSQTSRWRFYKV